ncbi:Hypothetical predicted protein [Paramuricea clavata]|uniref:Uncharacterized protein n=1 Tax=Paramuricea clavata TaxID=317549 RepID=A0A6S7K858_PARCT|nr:Hypothetical predicted protein [Paramuricea clavata]
MGCDEHRSSTWWSEGYRTWDDVAFKKRLRVSRAIFDFILNEISAQIVKQPTRMKPHPTSPATQLAICLYRLAHGVTYLTVGDLCLVLRLQLLFAYSWTLQSFGEYFV